MGEHLHVVHLLVVVEVPPHGGGELGVEHGLTGGHSDCLTVCVSGLMTEGELSPCSS